MNATIRNMLEREIQRTKNHLSALEAIMEEVLKEVAPKRSSTTGSVSRVPLIEKALSKIHGDRIFSIKEVTALAQRMDRKVDRRLIYNCIKSYLVVSVKHGEMEQISNTEFRRIGKSD